MTWLLLAGLPSFLYALTNHIDKHLLEEHFKIQDGVTILLLVSTLLSALPIPFFIYMSPTSVMPADQSHIPALLIIGLLMAALLYFYLIALNEEDTTTIIVFYSFLPILGLLVSNLVLGESFQSMQFVAMSLIVAAIIVMSVDKHEDGGFRLRSKAAFFMFLASLCWATGDVIFKKVALEENIWRTLFWEHLVLVIIGVVMFTSSRQLRSEMAEALRENSTKIIAINITNELLYIVANIISAFPLMMVQVAAVHLVQALQPIWVFLVALFLIKIGVSKEEFTRMEKLQRIFATSLAVAGTAVLAMYTPT